MSLEHSPFLLTKIEHDSTIFPPLLLAYTFDVLDHIRQHNQLNTIRYLLCTVHCALFDIYYILCTMHYALYTIRYLLCTMHYALFDIYYELCTIYYALCIIYYALYIRIYTYSYVSTILYVFLTYSLFHVEIRRNPVILISTRSSCRVE